MAPRKESSATPRKRNGKYVAIAMLALWLAILVAVYVVIVKLKLGGEEGIRLDRDAPSETVESAAD